MGKRMSFSVLLCLWAV